MTRYRRRRSKRSRSAAPSVSMVTYTRLIDLEVTPTASDVTALATFTVPEVDNTTGETQNRKLMSVHGQAMMAAKINAGAHAAALFCLRAAPELDDWPAVTDWDPFNDGPGGAGSYDGRPSPRPFGRKNFVCVTPGTGGVTEVFNQAHTYRSKAERLLRPGWVLQAGLYVRATAQTDVRVFGLYRFAVAG